MRAVVRSKGHPAEPGPDLDYRQLTHVEACRPPHSRRLPPRSAPHRPQMPPARSAPAPSPAAKRQERRGGTRKTRREQSARATARRLSPRSAPRTPRCLQPAPHHAAAPPRSVRTGAEVPDRANEHHRPAPGPRSHGSKASKTEAPSRVCSPSPPDFRPRLRAPLTAPRLASVPEGA